ncbi:MAG: 50S ribosomal protein L24 [Patescibacteria group bacterium]|nr:50S ribosomal protein L24 [Patescibacteria group bacterium]
MKVKKGDNVIVIAGSHKGKKGKILKSIPTKSMVIIEGINMRKKSVKARRKNDKGQIVEVAMPIHVSNVAKQK